MKTFMIPMPVVASCLIEECAYNSYSHCHARAITIGDSNDALCDTYFGLVNKGATHAKPQSAATGVGACKVQSCRHNVDYECVAEEISVGDNGSQIACLAYRRQ